MPWSVVMRTTGVWPSTVHLRLVIFMLPFRDQGCDLGFARRRRPARSPLIIAVLYTTHGCEWAQHPEGTRRAPRWGEPPPKPPANDACRTINLSPHASVIPRAGSLAASCTPPVGMCI